MRSRHGEAMLSRYQKVREGEQEQEVDEHMAIKFDDWDKTR